VKDHRYLAACFVHEAETNMRNVIVKDSLTLDDVCAMRQVLEADIARLTSTIAKLESAKRERALLRRGPSRPKSNRALDRFAKGEKKTSQFAAT
jgi:hypothetical protein